MLLHSSFNFISHLKLEFLKCVFIPTKKKNLLKEISPAEAQSHEHNKDRGIVSNKMGVWSGGTHFPCLLRFCVCCLSGILIPSCAYWWGVSGWVAGLHMLLWTCNLTWTFDHSFNQQRIKIFQTKLDLRSLYCRDTELDKNNLRSPTVTHRASVCVLQRAIIIFDRLLNVIRAVKNHV